MLMCRPLCVGVAALAGCERRICAYLRLFALICAYLCLFVLICAYLCEYETFGGSMEGGRSEYVICSIFDRYLFVT